MATRDRPFPLTLSLDALAVLVRGLESGVLEVMSTAAGCVSQSRATGSIGGGANAFLIFAQACV